MTPQIIGAAVYKASGGRGNLRHLADCGYVHWEDPATHVMWQGIRCTDDETSSMPICGDCLKRMRADLPDPTVKAIRAMEGIGVLT